MEPDWDIFCRVVDNYGDIGVCWRLARQLRAEHGLGVRLWVDDLDSLGVLCLRPVHDMEVVDGVEVRQWTESFPAVEAPGVVIEAFACELPRPYLEAMVRRPSPPRWINLEYLSAENWVEDCHGLASPHPSLPLTKHFFFPGFTRRTGGLLREAAILAERDAEIPNRQRTGTLEITLFCYDSAPVGEMLDLWAGSPLTVLCRVPPGKPLAAVSSHLGSAAPWKRGNLEVVPTPFVTQPEFDRLLWRSSVNFVRGEDSFIRAQWAARPFVWHAYPQDHEAHLGKLDAFLERYSAGLSEPAAKAARAMFHAWNTGSGLRDAWEGFAAQLTPLEQHNRRWAEALAAQGDLAANLVKFCASRI